MCTPSKIEKFVKTFQNSASPILNVFNLCSEEKIDLSKNENWP